MMHIISWAGVDDGAGYPALCRTQLQGAMSEAHGHSFIEIVYVLEGFCLHVCNDASALLMAGDLIALRPGDAHRYRGHRYVSIVNFLFLPEALSGVLEEVCTLPGMRDFFHGNPADERLLHRHLSLPDRQYVQGFFQAMMREREGRQVGWALRSKALLMDFLVFFSRIFSAQLPAHRADAAYMGYVYAALATIEHEYSQNLTVAGIAATLGITPDHLTRQFRQAMGITPIEYLRRYRFARALELLRAQVPVGEVYRAVGFHHISHFSREFKALFGITPSAFQKQARDQKATPLS